MPILLEVKHLAQDFGSRSSSQNRLLVVGHQYKQSLQLLCTSELINIGLINIAEQQLSECKVIQSWLALEVVLVELLEHCLVSVGVCHFSKVISDHLIIAK